MAQSNVPRSRVPKEINIVLLGESGVGKSTFINSCLNYLKYGALSDELLASGSKNQLKVLIPTRLEMYDIHGDNHEFDVDKKHDPSEVVDVSGDSIDDEVRERGKSGTQSVNTYVFPVVMGNKVYQVRFLDTPGMGHEEGLEQDEINCDMILTHISQFKEIHAFCLLFKPSNVKLNFFMDYCIIKILSRLESSAANNVVFVFTNTSPYYRPGATRGPLEVLLKRIEKDNNISIQFSSKNTFCFDNEGFRYAAGIRNRIRLQKREYALAKESWNISYAAFWRMLNYICQLEPHDPKKTISVNEARLIASNLSEPAVEILQVIDDNILKLKEHTDKLTEAKLTKKEILEKMHTPLIDIQVKNISSPHIVCDNPSCTSVYMVNGKRKVRYTKNCHENCWSGKPLTRYTSTGFELFSGNCKKCKHHISSHQYIYYELNISEEKTDVSLKPKLDSQEELIKMKQDKLKELREVQKEYENEKEIILNSCAILDNYSKNNSITPSGCVAENYLKYKINRQNEYHQDPNDETLNTLQALLDEFQKRRVTIENPLNKKLVPKDIDETKQKLFKLKHFGERISTIYNSKKAGIETSFKKNERVVKAGESGYFKKF